MITEPILSPVSVCEQCWLKDHSRWEPESMDAEGQILIKLTGVDVPTKVNTGTVEICYNCGGITVSGIFEMKDPKKIIHTGDNINSEFVDIDPEKENPF